MCEVHKIRFFINVQIELLPMKMFKIYKNYIHDDIFHAKPCLDTIQHHSKYNVTIFDKNIWSNDNFS